jgi:hypothetical protein
MWVSAGDLAAGDELRTAEATTNSIVEVADFVGAQIMYELTVDTTHTYYVVAGRTPILGHNCDPIADGGAKLENRAGAWDGHPCRTIEHGFALYHLPSQGTMRMRMTEVELLDRSGNWAVIQLPGRRFPGIFLQGDTFASLVRVLEQKDNALLPEDLQDLRSELIEIREYYEGVLREDGRSLPY